MYLLFWAFVVYIVWRCLCSGLTVFSEEQTRQQFLDLPTRQTSPTKPSTGLYESLDTSRPDAVVYAHMSPSSEPAYENTAVRPKDEVVGAVAPVYSN